jgi:hypothetical protein
MNASYRREQGLAIIPAHDICRQVLEIRSVETIAVKASVHGMTAALRHAQQLRRTLVELVIPHGIKIKADLIEGLDARFVME